MSKSDDETPLQRPPRRPSSINLLIWQNVDAWLSMREGRYVVWTGGGVFRVVDEAIGEIIVTVKPDEDPPTAIYRRGVQELIARGNVPTGG